MCENYLLSSHKDDIIKILECPDKEKYFSLNIDFLELFESDTNLGNALLTDPEVSLQNWNEAVFIVQTNFLKEPSNSYTLKNNVNCRIYNLPPWPHVSRTIFPGNDDANKFLQVTGTVVRMSARKLLEYQRQYICTKCKYPITVEAKYDKRNIIKQPSNCPNPEGCTGRNIITFGELDTYNCRDYQEIKIQEDLSKLGVGTVPNHMIVTLEDDLVNICKPGENVTITGIVVRRWSEFDKGVKISVDIVLKANHVQVNNSSGFSIAVSDETELFFNNFWERHINEPLVGRNVILRSIAPEIYGLHLVKLAIAIVLAGGSQNESNDMSTGIDTRSESHLLLVGDPGTGKSQMLRFASRIVPRSVLTTGVGSTAAGLTVTAIMENGEWQLEAGALVMADGGICCIDEFNSMKEHDRTSIHEAMEQQTISVAKAGMVCKLKTRCTILAACNPKGNINTSQPLCVNVAMSSPLLSRFDLILLLRDVVNEENDRRLAEYLLNESSQSSNDGSLWSLEKLQAYYSVIKKRNPKLTNDAETILSTYYQLQRKFGNRNKSRTTVRLLESLIRLSQGHAKLVYHTEVQVLDAIFAVMLVDCAMDDESSILNLRFSNDAFSDSPEEQYWGLLENILGKLNLDYIYQKEVQNCGVKDSGSCSIQKDDFNVSCIKQNGLFSQNSVSSARVKPSQGLFTQKRQDVFDDVENTGKAETSPLFSQSTSSQENRTLRNVTNASFSQNLSQLFSKDICDKIEAPLECPFIKKRNELNDTKDSGNYSDMTMIGSESMNEVSKSSRPLDKPSTSKDTECSKKIDLKSERSIEKGKEPVNLSQMIRLNSELDLELEMDVCFDNLGSSASKNKDDLSANNIFKAHKGPSYKNGSRKSNSPTKSFKKSFKKNVADEGDLFKLMPSVNDDFLDFDREIDWDMEAEISLTGAKRLGDFKEVAVTNIKKRNVDCDENEKIIDSIDMKSKMHSKKDSCGDNRTETTNSDKKIHMDFEKLEFAKKPAKSNDHVNTSQKYEIFDMSQNGENIAEKNLYNGENTPEGTKCVADSEDANNLPGPTKKFVSDEDMGSTSIGQKNVNTDGAANFLPTSKDSIGPKVDEVTKPRTSFEHLFSKFRFQPVDRQKSDTTQSETSNNLKECTRGNDAGGTGEEVTLVKSSSNDGKINTNDHHLVSNTSAENILPNTNGKSNFQRLNSKMDFFSKLDEEIDSLETTIFSPSEKISWKPSINSKTSNNIGLKSEMPSKKDSHSHREMGKNIFAKIIDMDLENLELDSDFDPFAKNPAKLNNEVNASQKHEIYDMSQNSKREFIKKKFVFKRPDAKKLPRSDFGE